MYNNIPQELQALPQWVCWKSEIVDGRQTKVPYGVNGRKANITNPSTWATFAAVMEAGQRLGMSGIGMVLTEHDPYTGIDIDNKPENPASEDELKVHQKILEAFPSYTERSVGGSGYHIIIRGKVPHGMDRGHVGVYSSSRYLTFTGLVIRNAPVLDCQAMLDVLYAEMQPSKTIQLEEREGWLDDKEVVEMAMGAVNADKFNELCRGNWTTMGYGSQSEADFALLAILAYYTPDNEQVRRLFRMSHLGKREKAIRNNTYLDFALGKIRANEPAPVDMDQVKANAVNLVTSVHIQPTEKPVEHTEDVVAKSGVFPPGPVGELAQFIYDASILPVAEMSLAAALGFMAGVTGRSYNVSNSGLNQYIMVLARTGTGKEGIRRGLDIVAGNLRQQIPLIDNFIGPTVFASGQAMIKTINNNPCFISTLGEFGIALQIMSDPRAPGLELMKKTVLLELYGKSGFYDRYQSMVYSDQEKNTKTMTAPCLSIIGDSNPTTFFETLTSEHVTGGLLPRFLFLEYLGGQKQLNPRPVTQMSPELKTKIQDLVVSSISIANQNTFVDVQHDSHAEVILKDFREKCRIKTNAKVDAVSESIWSRAYLKALKLAALVAVGSNPHRPIIDTETINWAIELVEYESGRIAKRFEIGDVGQGNSKQLADIKKIIEDYLKKPSPSILKDFGNFHRDNLVPYQFLRRRISTKASFKNDKLGETGALQKVINDMIDSGSLVLVPAVTLQKQYNSTGKVYGIGNHWSN